MKKFDHSCGDAQAKKGFVDIFFRRFPYSRCCCRHEKVDRMSLRCNVKHFFAIFISIGLRKGDTDPFLLFLGPFSSMTTLERRSSSLAPARVVSPTLSASSSPTSVPMLSSASRLVMTSPAAPSSSSSSSSARRSLPSRRPASPPTRLPSRRSSAISLLRSSPTLRRSLLRTSS